MLVMQNDQLSCIANVKCSLCTHCTNADLMYKNLKASYPNNTSMLWKLRWDNVKLFNKNLIHDFIQ